MKRQQAQKQLLFSVNLFRRVWVGSSRTLEETSTQSQLNGNSIQNLLLKKDVSFEANTGSIQKLIYASESNKSDGIRLGKMSIVLVYCSVVPLLGYKNWLRWCLFPTRTDPFHPRPKEISSHLLLQRKGQA